RERTCQCCCAQGTLPSMKKSLLLCLLTTGCVLASRETKPDAPVAEPTPQSLEHDCNGNNFEACAALGELRREGKGVQKDVNVAEALLRKACDGREFHACVALGKMYLAGTELGRNITLAADYFSLASGDFPSQAKVK